MKLKKLLQEHSTKEIKISMPSERVDSSDLNKFFNQHSEEFDSMVDDTIFHWHDEFLNFLKQTKKNIDARSFDSLVSSKDFNIKLATLFQKRVMQKIKES